MSIEDVNHGTSLNSLFVLLILAAMSSVLLREISIHGMEPSIPRRGVTAIYFGMTTGSLIVSMTVALFRRLALTQSCIRAVSGLMVGLAAATLIVVPSQSMNKVVITTALGSIGLIFIASLSARWQKLSSLNDEIEKAELERVDS